METRLERNRKHKKEKRKNRIKKIYIMILIILLIIGLKIVNQYIIELDCMENSNLFKLDIYKGRLEILGKVYYINILKEKTIKRPVSGLFVLHSYDYLL